MLRPTSIGLALLQAALKANKPGTLAHQIVWRGENTNAGVLYEPNGLKSVAKAKPSPQQEIMDAARERMAQPKYQDNGMTCTAWRRPHPTEQLDAVQQKMDEDEDAEGFYDSVNAFGFPQTFQRTPYKGVDDTGDSPVCSSCNASVMLNRGDGTACGACRQEFLIECRPEHDTGGLG